GPRPGRAAQGVRRRGAVGGRSRRRPLRHVPPVDAGVARGGRARAERAGRLDRVRRWTAVVADGAAQGRRRAGLPLLHQPHLGQGRRPRREPALRPALPVAPAGAPGAHHRRRARPAGRRRGRLLRQAAPRLAAGRVGLAPVHRGGVAAGARRRLRRGDSALRRRRGGAGAADVGRVRRAAERDRVLAGPAGPDARPPRLPACCPRSGLEHAPPRSL
ncbi:MAG: Pyridoxamine 5'-phosphate oxidase, partial [uncultured Nocardioides sp.]